MALSQAAILETLKQVYDPEIAVDIVNLGLVYEVRVDKGLVYVKITTTAPGCPVGNLIAAQVKQVVRNLAEGDRAIGGSQEVPEIVVETVYDPPWKMEMVSEEGRRMLGWE